MGACSSKAAPEQCAEIEDLLAILGIEVNVFRVVNPGAVEKLIEHLRRSIGDRRG